MAAIKRLAHIETIGLNLIRGLRSPVSFAAIGITAFCLLGIGCGRKMTQEGQDVRFTGDVEFITQDSTGEGISESLTAEVGIELLRAGGYVFIGVLKKDERVIVNRPAWESMLFTSVRINQFPGIYTISLRFSGEAIRQSGEDGPYELEVSASGEGAHATMKAMTPAYDHSDFGEL